MTYVGGAIDFSALDPFVKSRNVVYDIFSAESVDGVVLCGGSLGNGVSTARFNEFCARFASVPSISVGPAGAKIPRILVDNDRGMRDIIMHLINEHGCRKIACITGPKGNEDADRRRNMFSRTLLECGIAVDESLVYTGDFNDHSGVAAVKHWLDDLGVQPEAIVASNDNMAFGAIAALQERGISVPYGVAVTGFDDVPDAATQTPPLSTVSQPIYQEGRKALELLVRKLSGGTLDFETQVEPRLVCRESCGCLSATLGAFKESEYESKVAEAGADAIRRELSRSGRDKAPSVESLARSWNAKPRDERAFIAEFSNVLQRDIISGSDASSWYPVINLFRLSSAEGDCGALLHRAQAMVSDAERQAIFRGITERERKDSVLRIVEREILTSLTQDNLAKILAKSFPQLGLGGAILCLYDDPARPTAASKAIVAVRDGKALPTPKESFLPARIAPESVQFASSPKSPIVLIPLCYRETSLGYVAFEQTTDKGALYEGLTNEIGTAIQGMILIERVVRAERDMEARSGEIESLVRPMLESIGSINDVASAQRDEIGRLDALNRRSDLSVKGMKGIIESLSDVLGKAGELVAGINEISEVVNVVAINASIEAAHFGKQGTAFAVIAGEVRKLAGTTRKNAEGITGFLDEIGTKIAGLYSSNQELSDTFAQLKTTVQASVEVLGSISARMETLDRGSNEILKVMNSKALTT
ncbi:MAG TPA: substrate-binding domain-containing protein [Treponemataceae bacterium]|mgnify:CR=1 FL=1|nr:substrate-binding domain-containing protein [Treponemataceae bacterium]